jgi:hypothetical protein
MNVKQLIALVSLTAATGAVFAAQPSIGESLAPKTRAEVVASLQQANADNQLLTGEASQYPTLGAAAPAMTRTAVTTGVQQANAAHQLLTGEASQYPFAPQKTAAVSRAAVKSELQQAMADGDVQSLTAGA